MGKPITAPHLTAGRCYAHQTQGSCSVGEAGRHGKMELEPGAGQVLVVQMEQTPGSGPGWGAQAAKGFKTRSSGASEGCESPILLEKAFT